jgi:L-ribulokinase
MFAATAAGYYPRVEDAMEAMGQGFDAEYFPDPGKASIYTRRYVQYSDLGNFIEKQINIHSNINSLTPAFHPS